MTQCSTLINLILIYIITLMGNCSASKEGHSRSLELDLYLQSKLQTLNSGLGHHGAKTSQGEKHMSDKIMG